MARPSLFFSLGWLAISFGCASAPSGSAGLPPYILTVAASPDSAIRLFRLALEAERLPADGAGLDAVASAASTFVVRRGGIGEAEIIVTARAHAEPALPQARVSSILEISATARERRGMIAMSPEEARSPTVLRRDHHAINPNDREVLGTLGKIVDRLGVAGAVSRRTPPVP